MDGSTLFITLLGVLLLGGCLLYFGRHLAINVLNPLGNGMEKKTTRILKKHGGIRGYKTLTHLDIAVEGKTAHIENLLIGYFGLLLVTTCTARGAYYGNLDDQSWMVNIDDGKQKLTIPNPFLEQEQAESLLRALFSKNEVYNVPIEHVVYIASPSRKAGLYVTNSGEILLPGKLSGYLKNPKFDRDNGLDVDKLAKIVQDAAQNT